MNENIEVVLVITGKTASTTNVGGLNFQIEHHLFPNISHIHYRKIAPIVESTAKEFGFIYNLKPTFLKAFYSHIHRLKELGKFS